MSTTATTTPAQFVCPLCERTFTHHRLACAHCDSTLVVPLEDGTVYETVLPMCGK